jgi:hypothetical protein
MSGGDVDLALCRMLASVCAWLGKAKTTAEQEASEKAKP